MSAVTPTFHPTPDPRPDDEPWPPMRWPPDQGARLTGHTVVLRPLDLQSDSALLFAALDHEDAWRHLPGRTKDPAAYTAALRARIDMGQFLWTVRLRKPVGGLTRGAVVGRLSYLDVSAPDARLEIATQLAPAVWGTAVNPESKLLLFGHAFDVLGAGRVQLKTDARNIRSQRAIARLGAVYEGTLRRYQRRDDGTVRDTVVFSVCAEDWPRVRQSLRDRIDR